MKRGLCYGISTVMVASALFTYVLREHAWIPRCFRVSWVLQFALELSLALLAVLVGMRLEKTEHRES